MGSSKRVKRPPYLQPLKRCTQKENTHAPCKTEYKTERPPQKDPEAREWLLPHQIQALPGCARGRRALAQVRLHRTQTEEATVPLALDRPHQRSLPDQRHELLDLYQRP